jgi:hypothetical protein
MQGHRLPNVHSREFSSAGSFHDYANPKNVNEGIGIAKIYAYECVYRSSEIMGEPSIIVRQW